MPCCLGTQSRQRVAGNDSSCRFSSTGYATMVLIALQARIAVNAASKTMHPLGMGTTLIQQTTALQSLRHLHLVLSGPQVAHDYYLLATSFRYWKLEGLQPTWQSLNRLYTNLLGHSVSDMRSTACAKLTIPAGLSCKKRVTWSVLGLGRSHAPPCI